MNSDILLWSNVEILNALDKWGVLTIRNLQLQLCSNISLNGLRKKLHKLATEDFIQISRLDKKNEMIVIPTRKALNQLKSNRSLIDDSMVYHNLFISMLGIELLAKENVMYFKLPHEYRKSRMPVSMSSSIEPDAYLGVKHNDKTFKVAIEVELTQKSSDRVYEKFIQYKDSLYFDYAIYFFTDVSILTAYRKRLTEVTNELKDNDERKKINGKIIFLYSSRKHQYGSILENPIMECQGRELSLDKFFGLNNTI